MVQAYFLCWNTGIAEKNQLDLNKEKIDRISSIYRLDCVYFCFCDVPIIFYLLTVTVWL